MGRPAPHRDGVRVAVRGQLIRSRVFAHDHSDLRAEAGGAGRQAISASIAVMAGTGHAAPKTA
jgi:hypothetical protein